MNVVREVEQAEHQNISSPETCSVVVRAAHHLDGAARLADRRSGGLETAHLGLHFQRRPRLVLRTGLFFFFTPSLFPRYSHVQNATKTPACVNIATSYAPFYNSHNKPVQNLPKINRARTSKSLYFNSQQEYDPAGNRQFHALNAKSSHRLITRERNIIEQ